LGRAGERKARERPSWAEPHGRKRKEEKEDGPGQKGDKRKRENEMHSNVFEFKFKWKPNNKTMQYGMKCTKPIFPYNSFYG
jgi:hypothetical protein